MSTTTAAHAAASSTPLSFPNRGTELHSDWMLPSWLIQRPAAPPASLIPLDAPAETHFRALQDSARDLGHGGVHDMRSVRSLSMRGPTGAGALYPTIVCLAHPGEHFAFLLSGGKLEPGAFLLASSPTWLFVQGGKMYLKQGLWFDGRLDRWFLDYFVEPRLVTYWMNFMTTPSGGRDDGVPLEDAAHDTPTSSSHRLEFVTNDKFHTRLLLFRAGISVPVSICFIQNRQDPLYHAMYDTPEVTSQLDSDPADPRILRVFRIPDKDDDDRKAFYKQCVAQFSEFAGSANLVVKPSGPHWMGSKGVSVHPIGDVDGIVNAMLEVTRKLYPGENMLVDSYLETLKPVNPVVKRDLTYTATYSPTLVKIATNIDHLHMLEQESGDPALVGDQIPRWPLSDFTFDSAFRVRVITVRTPWSVTAVGSPPLTGADWEVAEMVCAVGPSRVPLHGVNTTPQPLEATLRAWGIDDEQCTAIRDSLARDACEGAAAIVNWEKINILDKGRLRKGSQSDVFGFDFILSRRGAAIVPSCIEVNDHDCSYQATLLEFAYPSRRWRCGQAWAKLALTRSNQFIMNQKTILLVGAGYYSKMRFIQHLAQWGLKIVLLDQNGTHPAKSIVKQLVCVPGMNYHNDDHALAVKCLQAIQSAGLCSLDPASGSALPTVRSHKFDGVLCIWEDATVLAAMLAKQFGLVGNAIDIQLSCKNKSLTQQRLWAEQNEVDWRPRNALYASPTIVAHTEEEFLAALDQLGLPIVLKPPFGSSAVGVRVILTKDRGLAAYRKMAALLKEGEAAHSGSGLSFASTGVLMEPFLEGTEHDVDIVLQDGRVLFATVTDNGPTRLPLFAETSECLPSVAHPCHQESLLGAAAACCVGIGLRNGVYNVELKLAPSGPRLVEVNGRMAGFYCRDYILRVTGVDILLCAAQIVLGMRSYPFEAPKPREYLAGLQLFTNHHNLNPEKLKVLQRLHSEGTVILTQLEETIPAEEEYEEPFGNLACSSPTSVADACHMLETIMKALSLDKHLGSTSTLLRWMRDAPTQEDKMQ